LMSIGLPRTVTILRLFALLAGSPRIVKESVCISFVCIVVSLFITAGG
jgi:hypothetical protein